MFCNGNKHFLWNQQSVVFVSFQLPCLERYNSYCSNQVAAKALLDHKKQDHRVHDFLQRCLESPFSRKLDLWNFLDIPRSRLVKYPLLLKEIQKHTPNDHPDCQNLDEAVSSLHFAINLFVFGILFTVAVLTFCSETFKEVRKFVKVE